MAKNNDHLSAAKANYRKCVFSLANRDYDKAIYWINAAIGNVMLDLQSYSPDNTKELSSRKSEYEKLKSAIEAGSQNAASERIFAEFGIEDDATASPKTARNVKTGALKFDDVVGLDDVKQTILGAIVYPFKYKSIYSAFKRKSGGGILLYGAPGTGKTMIAKAIAGEINAEFITVNCSDIYSKWMGESQKNIKNVFDRARKAQRAVIFFDEFEALGCARKGNEYSSNTDDVVCELLAQIDGFCSDSQSTILVIAATNRPWDVDSALRRSGRFERHLYVDMPDAAARVEIIRKQMSGLPIEDICYDQLGNRTDGFSPADVTQVCNRVKDLAIMRSIRDNEISNITQQDFDEVLDTMHSTVDLDELSRLKCFA